jgi:thiamine-monophosphate kinase
LGALIDKKKGGKAFIKKAIKSVMKPKPKLGFGLKNKKYFSSSMDSSDGLSTTLNEMSKQSKKKFVINNIPSKKDLEEHVRLQKQDLKKLVFHGGEEYEFVFTINPKHKQIVLKNAKLLKVPIIEIGHVTSGSGVFVQENNKNIRLKDLGWKHFR